MSGLIVPVDVLAYCIGKLDAHGPARGFAGATTDYTSQVTSRRPAFLGINAWRDATQPPRWPLEAGVHLHWAMPDALTRADTSSAPVRFPALPNRWLVTRIAAGGSGARHWIILSDALSTEPPGGNHAPTVPVQEAGSSGATAQRGFRYLGAWQVFDARWREPGTLGASLADLTHGELHAVTTGDIAFAAFYPNARSVFGFHDDCADLGDAPAELTYRVTGWYSASDNDPLRAGLSPTELETQLGWTIASASPVAVSYSVYSGFVHGVDWNRETRYLSDMPDPIAGDVAIGNHPAEALAAYFRGNNQPTSPAFEELLTLYLTGLAPDLAVPQAGQLAALDQALHELQFTGLDGGTIYTIMRGAREATGLPLPLADALNLLDRRQQDADRTAAQVRQGKWQLFASWYRLFQVDPNDPVATNAAFAAFTAQLGLQAAIAQAHSDAAGAAQQQYQAVTEMLSGDLKLTPVPAPRYYTPTEPVVLLAGDAAAPAERYGGDGRYHPSGYLVCRLDSDVLIGLTIAPATRLVASGFAALAPPALNLPYPVIGALVEEAALLDPAIGATASGIAEPALAADLIAWLDGEPAKLYGEAAGVPPSPVAVNAWAGGNPWCSLMLLWEVHFHPLLATTGGVDYPADAFTANYRLDPDAPRDIAYAPTPSGITVDPATIDFDPSDPQSGTYRLQGTSVLSPTAADNLRAQLASYLPSHPDPTLQAIADQLAATDVVMQSMTGFNDALLTRQRSLQLAIGVSPEAPLPFYQATQQVVAQIASLTDIPPLAPQTNSTYNALRAGYLQLRLQVMDPFGRKRPVTIRNLYIADSLATRYDEQLEPGIVYAQPRLAQPSRLVFHWLAADTTEYDEMNAHPATTPVCGWLLPDHLAVGFFLYNAQGNPLGSLTLRADASGIAWQATPGDQGTIDADLATVMQHQNPHLRELALALGGSTPAWFTAFWRATDAAVAQIMPAGASSQAGLAALVGRPLAIVQASLRLERQGIAAFDQSFTTLSDGQFPDTDHALGGVQFPVVIGDLARLDDGLVGYFTPALDGSGYDMATFYSQAAPPEAAGVVAPSPTNLLLAPAATPETAPATPPGASKLLMLVDPRAPVHATMGIVPTQTLEIPPDQYEDILAGLELTFPATPLLRARGGLSVPLPAIAGFDWSWITEQPGAWAVDPQLGSPSAGAVWQYSPQSITEGWLRLNPELLAFRLADTAGTPVVTAGTTMSLVLTVTNARRVPVVFSPAPAIGGEAEPGQGSRFYVHFGALVDQAQVAAIRMTAPGWQFQPLRDTQYGSYWGASPSGAAVTLAPGAALTIAIEGVAIAPGAMAQARVYFDYYGVTGDDDGISIAVLAVQQPAGPRTARYRMQTRSRSG